MNLKYTILFLHIIYLNTLNAIELDPINVEDSFENIAITSVDEEFQINNQTLSQKLFNNVNINQIDSSTNSNLISIRGNNFRATDYYEDGIPLYKTANGFADLSMYNDSSVLIDINYGAAQSLYAPSAIGGEIVLKSKKLKSGLSGYIDTSLSTNSGYFNTLLSNKTEDYYFKFMINGMKQNYFTLSNNFTHTYIQKDDKRVNSDKEQINGYLKAGYKINSKSDIAFKVSYLRGEFGLPVQVYDEPSNPFSSEADYLRVANKELSSYWFYYDYKNNEISLTVRSYYDDYTDTLNFYNTPHFKTLKFNESIYKDNRLGSIISMAYNYSSNHTSSITATINKNTHKQIVGNSSDDKEYESIDSSLSYMHEYKYSDKLIITASLKYKLQKLTKVYEFNNENLNYDDNEALDAQLTLNYSYDKKQSYYFSIAHKNRFASLVELYPFFPWDIPTKNVKPEESDNIEIGTQLSLIRDTDIKLSTYYNKVKNMILFDGIKYENSQKATIKGFEVNINNYYFKNNEIELSYAYTNAKDKSGEKIINIPTSKLNIADRILLTSDIDFLVNYLYVSSINDSYNSKIYTLSSYSLLDTQISYSPLNNLTIKGGVKNLFDKNWEYRYAQPSKGRSFFVDLKYTY